MIKNKGEIMGRKGVSKRKPKKAKSFSNADISGSSNVRSGERSLVQSLVKDKGAPFNRGGTNPATGSIKKTEKESKYSDDVMIFIVFKYYRGEKTMKLNLLFIVMDLLTLLAYPIVFVYGKLRQFSKSKESITLANL
jgi:hypothetical protein